jgi:wyosine [tRNA(Phe)-imidazoG37] synthetase (radical SAM superfamily)
MPRDWGRAFEEPIIGGSFKSYVLPEVSGSRLQATLKEESMLLDLQGDIIYGPVRSRRLGRSLGINILPSGRKVCSFDCLYCQYGFSQGKTREEAGKRGHSLPTVNKVLWAVEQARLNLSPPAAYLTFSGNGEATLHPGFKEIVLGLGEIRNRLSPVSKTAILSNSSTVNDPLIREALALLDVRIMKLDAGTEEMFARYNRPAKGITLEDTVAGLAVLENVTIQSLFTKGLEGNFTPVYLEAWVEQVKKISPLFVQLYTLDRESPTTSLIPVDKNELLHIHSLLEKENIASGLFY